MILPSTPQPSSPNFQLSMDTPGKCVTDLDSYGQSLKLILLTEPGTDVMRPDFGVGVHSMIGQPIGPIRGNIRRRLEQQVTEYIPEIKITSLAVTQPSVDHLQIVVNWTTASSASITTIVTA